MTETRRAGVERKTKESDIVVEIDLDGTGVVSSRPACRSTTTC